MSAYMEGMDVGKPATFRRMLRTMCPAGWRRSTSQERPLALEVRTAEHLEHQDRAFFGAQADAHGADATSLSGVTDGTSSLPEDIAHNPKRVAHVTVRAT